MSKKLIFLAILFLIIGGLFYFLFIWEIPEEQETSQGPTLFTKEDYKIDEREDGKYIVVEKVGLTCKVPEGWSIEKKITPDIEPQYWVDLYSPDMTTTVNNILTDGCVIDIMAITAKQTNEKIRENIKLLKESPEKSDEIKEDYILAEKVKIVKIDESEAIEIISQANKNLGQAINIDIPIKSDKWISFNIAFPLKHKEKCFSIWEEFIKNIIIE